MDSILQAIGAFLQSIGINTLFGIGLIVFVLINLFIIAGWFGITILPFEGFKIARFKQSWGTKALAIAALAGAVKVVLQFASAPLVLVPGVITFRLDNLVATAMGLIAGPAAVWGLVFGNVIGDTLAGTLNLGSIGGALANWFGNFLVFVLVTDPFMRKGKHYWQYLVYIIVLTLGVDFYLCTFFQIIRLMPTEVVWTAVFPSILVAVPPSIILVPALVKLLAPLMDRWNLMAKDIGFKWLSGPRVDAQTEATIDID
ncbi:MAG: hypothetical protein IT308_09680 [Anaerolineaceae bacterium]|nr:hypothetical protein [Anaerolineaceae bacterium]